MLYSRNIFKLSQAPHSTYATNMTLFVDLTTSTYATTYATDMTLFVDLTTYATNMNLFVDLTTIQHKLYLAHNHYLNYNIAI